MQAAGSHRDAIRDFRIGLSDASGQQLLQKLKKFGEALLVESGLIARRQEGGGSYDRFRGRLMFPIHDSSGKVIAFGGRALRPDEKVKYLNSPETRLYTKSSVLYNMHRAKIAARKLDRMVLVEGYMDAIGVYAAGIQEVVATCGTALSLSQIRAVKQEVSFQSGRGHVILNFDSDAAGARSTEKYISTLLAQGLRVKVLAIPGELDPDEYIQTNGASAYQKLLEQAPSYFHWLADEARKKFDTKTAEGRVDAFKLLLPAIEQVQDRIERAAIATEVAEQLGIGRELVQHALRQKSASEPLRRPRDVLSAVPPNEKLLLACMLASVDARAVIRHYLRESHALQTLDMKPIFEGILNVHESGHPFSLASVTEKLEPHYEQILMAISFSESGIAEEHAAEQALACLKLLESKSVQAQCEALKKRIRDFENEGKFTEAIRLMNELDAVKRLPSRG